ncbi:MAG: hypothetical protein EAZ77_09895 [Nostocales cyanobacterium]|nr:MAG: hypothetical protein EAZ77_09895 [Nostocales cyanobacterium]
MPKGVPKTGKRNPGGGRSKKYGADTVQKWIPVPIAGKLDDLYAFLIELDIEIGTWETTCEAKKTSPRYEQARKLAASIRERIDGLGIDIKGIYASSEEE